jgi:hypothetical protein
MDVHQRFAARVLLGLAVFAFPAVAAAQEPAPPTAATLAVGKFDRQLTQVPLKLTCTSAAAGTCNVIVRASWSLVDQRSGAHRTQPLEFARVPLSVPVGTTGALDVKTVALGLRNKASKRIGAAALVDLEILDAAGTVVDFGSAFGFVPAFRSDCHQPRSFPFTGGPVEQETLDNKGFETVVSDHLDSTTVTNVGAKGAAFSLFGVRYEFGPNSQFSLLCSALTDYASGKPFPTVVIEKGSVHVSGKPRGPQYVASIFTPEGSLGSRSQERIDFKVTRNAAHRRSTLRVKRGRTTQITPVNSSTRSPCTNGHALTVDRHGRVTKA